MGLLGLMLRRNLIFMLISHWRSCSMPPALAFVAAGSALGRNPTAR